ncbi:hypothetical protein VIGAN_06086500 [Vigna angularis var. angularis]|uniref:Uncharacterized protein n=1 Tax=Vigna angularis var. angularis TaxID=157739 RepID=A0A0S3SAH7_PHAAN|nr:hypothetical protein VIGAN_06086500 [Vigna angularis var. angularis]
MSKFYAKDITPDDKQELDDALLREIQAAFRTDEIKRTPLRPQDEMRPRMSYFHETIWNGVSRFHQAICTFLRSYGNDMINIDHCCYHHLRVLIHLNRVLKCCQS